MLSNCGRRMTRKTHLLLRLLPVWHTRCSLSCMWRKNRSCYLILKCKGGHSYLFWTACTCSTPCMVSVFMYTQMFPRERLSQSWFFIEIEQVGIGWAISGWGSRVEHLKSCQLVSEMINNKHVLNFCSVEDTVTKCCTWFVSVESSQPVK